VVRHVTHSWFITSTLAAALSLLLSCRGGHSVSEASTPRPAQSRPTDPRPSAPAAPTSLASCEALKGSALGAFDSIAPGGRFALFDQYGATWTALDLERHQIGAPVSGRLERIVCGEHCAAYSAHAEGLTLGLRARPASLQLRDLSTGAEASFEGENMRDAQLPSHLAALRSGHNVGLLDARARVWMARAGLHAPASSVALSVDGRRLYVLAVEPSHDAIEDRPELSLWIEVLDIGLAQGGPVLSHRVAYSQQQLQQIASYDGSMYRLSAPRIYRLDSGAIVIGHKFGCDRCAGSFPEGHVFRELQPQSGAPTQHGGFALLRQLPLGSLEAKVWSAADHEPRRPTPMPERVRRALDEVASRCPAAEPAR